MDNGNMFFLATSQAAACDNGVQGQSPIELYACAEQVVVQTTGGTCEQDASFAACRRPGYHGIDGWCCGLFSACRRLLCDPAGNARGGRALDAYRSACRRQCVVADRQVTVHDESEEPSCLDAALQVARAWILSAALSYWLLTLLGLVRMLLFGCPLRGGDKNWDPLIRGGRKLLKGAPVRLLFATQMARLCTSGAAMPLEGADPWTDYTVFVFNEYMEQSAGVAPTTEFEGPARPLLFIPEVDSAPWQWHLQGNEFEQDVEGSDSSSAPEPARNWIAPIAVRSFQCVDQYCTIWLRTDESPAQVCVRAPRMPSSSRFSRSRTLIYLRQSSPTHGCLDWARFLPCWTALNMGLESLWFTCKSLCRLSMSGGWLETSGVMVLKSLLGQKQCRCSPEKSILLTMVFLYDCTIQLPHMSLPSGPS